MSEFVQRLKQGMFMIPVCTRCGKKAWPPSSTCQKCYSRTALRRVDTKGVLVEFATSHVKSHEGVFGIVQMEGFWLIGSFANAQITEGMQVRMVECGMRDGTPYYLFAPER